MVQKSEDLIEAVKEVRQDSNETNWCLGELVQEGGSMSLNLVGKGSGGFDELISHFSPSKALYALIRVSQKIDLSTTVKFAYINFIGEEVPALQRGKIGAAHGDIKPVFSPFHADFEISEVSEVSQEIIESKLSESSGKKDNVRELSFDSPSMKPSTPTKKSGGFGFQAKPASGGAINSDAAVASAIAEVRSDKSELNWCLVGYEGNDLKKGLILISSGQGGCDELVSNLGNELVAYCFIRVIDVIEGIKTVKFALITFVGADVTVMKKAKVTTNKGGVAELFNPIHVSLEISNSSEISDEILLDCVQDASGSKSKVKK